MGRGSSFNSDFYGNKAIERNLRLNESKSINKSLFFLTQVIFLASKGKHIIYHHKPNLIERKESKTHPIPKLPPDKNPEIKFWGKFANPANFKHFPFS